MRIRDKEIELSDYLLEWYDARNADWNEFKRELNINKYQSGICAHFPIDGPKILQLVENLVENLNDKLVINSGHVIPSKFASIRDVLQNLKRLDDLIKNDFSCVKSHFKGEDTDWEIAQIAQMWYEYHAMFVRCMEVYSIGDDVPLPYQSMIYCLNENNIDGFIQLMKSAIKNVPYNIHKEKMSEGYFHTIVHVILSVLGMKPFSEAETSDGRIDVMVETPMRVYIIEFKYEPKSKSKAQEALNQIKDNSYAMAYLLYNKEIIGIGVSFSGKDRNINDYRCETLYTPSLLPSRK